MRIGSGTSVMWLNGSLLVRSDDNSNRGLEKMVDLASNDPAHFGVLQDALPQRQYPETDVARLVPSDRGEPGDEAGQDADLAQQSQRIALATQRQIPLDDQVVRHDRFDECDRVLGLESAAVWTY